MAKPTPSAIMTPTQITMTIVTVFEIPADWTPPILAEIAQKHLYKNVAKPFAL
jgi:hypothetical protein